MNLTAVCRLQALHVGLRYKALSLLELPNLNQKRGAALVLAHVAGIPLPGTALGTESNPNKS